MEAPRSAIWVALGASLAFHALAQSAPTPAQQQLREIYKELVEINTTDSAGSCTAAAEAMAARLKAGGLLAQDVQVIVPPGGLKKGNLVARYRGTGAKRPVMLLGHLDVVEAKREDWERDPFKLVEESGYFYARGASDDKAMVAVFVANLIRYGREGYRPERDLILVATCDEEIIPSNFSGIVYLLKKNGNHLRMTIQAGEKVFQTYQLEVTNPGGHSSVPVKDNAIYHLAGGLARLAATALNNSTFRTTCVATMLEAGHATNALPQRARATVNCRILPGEPVAEVQKTLARVMANDKIRITPTHEPTLSPAPPLTREIVGPVETVSAQMWPGVPVVPTLLVAATDGRFTINAGIPTYGVNGMFRDPDGSGVHGLNERIRVRSLYEGHEFLYRLVKLYAGGK